MRSVIMQDSSEGMIFIEATGFSMWPFLKAGERLVIKKADVGEVSIGDIILYKKDNQLICHRLVKKISNGNNWLLYARGDNTIFGREELSSSLLLGKVIGVVKKGKIIDLNTRKAKALNKIAIIFSPLISILVHLCLPAGKFFKRTLDKR